MANIFERYGIDYRKPKYWMPLFCYPFIWFIGYKVIETIDFEAPEKVDETLVTKNEFNVDLPSAHVGDDLGDKMDMTSDGAPIQTAIPIINIMRDERCAESGGCETE